MDWKEGWTRQEGWAHQNQRLGMRVGRGREEGWARKEDGSGVFWKV